MKPFGRTFEWDYCYLVFYNKKFQSFVIFFSLATIKSENINLVWDLMILFLDYALSSGEIDRSQIVCISIRVCRSCLKNGTKLKQLQDHNNVIISPFNNFLKSIFCGVVKRTMWGCFVPFSCRRKQAKNLNLQRVQKGKRYTCSLHLLDVINFSLCLLDCKTVRISAKSSIRK